MLPRNFSWLEKSTLAGSSRPETEAELLMAKNEGIRAIVSLTRTPLNPEIITRLGLVYLHEPISSAPPSEQLKKIIQFIMKQKTLSNAVLVHCTEGMGRTGTILAAYLVHHGSYADDAIRMVREKRPGSIQTLEQENTIREFEKIVSRENNHS